jgi:bromodomain adjacent to zinc finger domain protein 1A
LEYHPLAANLNLEPEEVLENDDPMKYFYSARLIVEGSEWSGSGEEFEGSLMEVQADKISYVSSPFSPPKVHGLPSSLTVALPHPLPKVLPSRPSASQMISQMASLTPSRDRINFSRAMLKRFIRDCVDRDPAVYSPWIVKPQLAARYGIPTEMSDEIREEIESFRERQMDRRKRERDERLGLVEEEEVPVGRKKVKKEVEVKEEDKKKPMKFPAEGTSPSLFALERG